MVDSIYKGDGLSAKQQTLQKKIHAETATTNRTAINNTGRLTKFYKKKEEWGF